MEVAAGQGIMVRLLRSGRNLFTSLKSNKSSYRMMTSLIVPLLFRPLTRPKKDEERHHTGLLNPIA